MLLVFKAISHAVGMIRKVSSVISRGGKEACFKGDRRTRGDGGAGTVKGGFGFA